MGSHDDHAKTKMVDERIEILVTVQRIVPGTSARIKSPMASGSLPSNWSSFSVRAVIDSLK
jgi:hypothetical protein